MVQQEIGYQVIESFITGVLGVEPQKGRVYTPEQIAQARQVIDGVLSTLDFREREVVRARSGLYDGYTFTSECLGQKLGVSRERVLQIEARAIGKLKSPQRREMLEGLLGYSSPKN